jgi:uncharacterized repeat protein (TIGR01451 family)
MRWAEWILRQLSQSRQSARRTTRLAVYQLEDRTVPDATGVVHTDHSTDPAPSTVVVKEETPPPAPTPDPVIHLDDPVVEPATGSGEAKDGGVADGTVTPEEKLPPADAPADPPIVPKDDGEVVLYTMNGAADTTVQTPKPKPPLPQIGDRVWLDQNANGQQDAGEQGIGFVTLQLYSGNKLVGTTTTDGMGAYAFNLWNVDNGTADPTDNGLKAGTAYQIRIAGNQFALAGLRPTFVNVGTGNPDEQRDSDATANNGTAVLEFTMGPDEIYTHYDIGYLPAASVGNLVWSDLNNNGKKDLNEPGIAGVTVRLLDESGALVATTTTAMDGSYKFDGLLPATYVVEVAASNFATGAALAGLTSSTGKPGQIGTATVEGAGTPDPNTNTTDGDDNGMLVNAAVQCKPVALEGGSDNPTVDFGFFRSSTLTGRVYVDINGNGRIDPEDTAGIAKVRIRVSGPAGTFVATTDPSGNYQFKSLPTGTYTVTEIQPTGYRSSTPNMATMALTGGTGTMNFGEARVADLRVTVSANHPTVGVGGMLILTYRIKNLGTLDATGVMLTAPIPGAYKFVSSDKASDITYSAVTQRASIGTLAAGDEVKIQLKLRAIRPAAVRFHATVQAQELEDNLRNNTAAVIVTSLNPSPAPMGIRLFSRG